MQSHLYNIYRYKVSGEFQFEIILFVNTMSDHGRCPAQDTILTVPKYLFAKNRQDKLLVLLIISNRLTVQPSAFVALHNHHQPSAIL